MRVELFDFALPEERIASEPASPRDSSKLLCIPKNGVFQDKHAYDLDTLLLPSDVLVFNDTKVLPARLYGMRGQAHIEATLLKQLSLDTWECLIKNARRLKQGDEISFAENFNAAVLSKSEDGPVRLKFNRSGTELFEALHTYGIMPLPPYIHREKGGKESDKADYQTIYAKNEGAVAAPTAGLHFTEELFKRLDEKGVQRVFVTLHVGGGTFLPMKAADTKDHKMHAEFGVITQQTADFLNEAKRQGRRIISVGTTSLRLLESAADDKGVLHPFCGETDIFITPGYRFKFIDLLWTNFHLPKSTLFMLVCAFAGMEKMKKAYRHAIERQYRFFSYGDACLIEKDDEAPIPPAEA